MTMPNPSRQSRWLTGTSMPEMTRLVRERVPLRNDSPAAIRKLRLFFAACCRLMKDLPVEATFWKAIDLAERDADEPVGSAELAAMKRAISEMDGTAFGLYLAPDGEVSLDDRRSAHLNTWAALWAREVLARHVQVSKAQEVPEGISKLIAQMRTGVGTPPDDNPVKVALNLETANLLRDIFGNPFRPVKIQKRWVTANVADLARTIYEERVFDRLPILADALMDAGCDEEAVLSHCRSAGPHARGCWVVDLILGKGF